MSYSYLSLLLIALLATPLTLTAEVVRVAVAANFTDACRDLAPRFERATGHRVKISYGSTGKLYAQIVHGAPYQLFLAADSQRPARLEQEGETVRGSRFTYALGRLVLWSPDADRFDDGEGYLRNGNHRHLAIANPKTAPYGAAARQVLEGLGLWNRLRGRVVRGDSIAQTFQFVASGNSPAGFVALSQVNNWRGVTGVLWQIPEEYYRPIEQQAVLLKRGAKSVAARAFLDYLKGDEAQALIKGYGYGVR